MSDECIGIKDYLKFAETEIEEKRWRLIGASMEINVFLVVCLFSFYSFSSVLIFSFDNFYLQPVLY